MSNFHKYSAYYDLLYGDKDYAAEAGYVARAIRKLNPAARTILEFGSGTGRHGRLLARLGFEVHGIERSPEMVALARATPASLDASGSFTCEIGDVCALKLDRRFDAIIALFHVMSYQTTDDTLRAAFANAAAHLAPGGLFLFDVWHGPAVLFQKPSERVKEVADERRRVKRFARPKLDEKMKTVTVVYEMECEDKVSSERTSFREEHLIRYLFPEEIDAFAGACGLHRISTEEFLTGRPPSPDTWGVAYVLQRRRSDLLLETEAHKLR
jgi:SAM-dependent methyltransferase